VSLSVVGLDTDTLAVRDAALCTDGTHVHDKSHTQSFDTYGRQIYEKVYLNFRYSP